MKTHARAGSLAVAAAALLASTLTAGPALAAKPIPAPSINQSYCNDLAGPNTETTYYVSKTYRECATFTTTTTYGDVTADYNENASGTLRLQYSFIPETITEVSAKYSQTGKKAIQSVSSQQVRDTYEVVSGTSFCFADDADGVPQDADLQVCYDAGVVPDGVVTS